MSSLKRAYLKFLKPGPKGPTGPTTVRGKDQLEFSFNPKEYTVAKSAEWKRDAAKGAKQVSKAQYIGPQARSVTLEMFLDASGEAKKDVSEEVETLMSCLVPLPDSGPKPLPPYVQFGWGAKVLLIAFVKTVSAKYTMFRPDGSPVRAVCSITLEEVPDPSGKQNPTSGALHATSSRVVVAGDSLASLAFAEYGDPTLWRAVADANRIDDPLRMRPGLRLLMPAVEDLAEISAGQG